MSRITRARPSPSMVIAFIALLVAGGGAAFAAIPDSDDGEIHGCYSTRNGDLRVIDAEAGQTCGNRETALVWNQQGPPGTPGTPGPAGASALTGSAGNQFDFFQAETVYAAPSGFSPADADEDRFEQLSPNSTIVARDLAVKVRTQTENPAPSTATFTLRDDGAAAISCTITIPGQPPVTGTHTCDSGATTATISPGSELSFQIAVVGFGAVVAPVKFGWRATTP
jgi:hypothetical protein